MPDIAPSHGEAEPLKDVLLAVVRHVEAAEGGAAGGIVGDDLGRLRRRAGADDLGRLAARQIDRHRRRQLQPILEEGGIDAALEPAPRVREEGQLLSGQSDMLGIEIGAFDEDVGGRFGDSAMLAAHDPADVVDGFIVGDHGHRGIEPVALAVERQHLLAVARAAGDERAFQGRQVVDVERPAVGQHDVVGEIDQGADRPLSDRLQPPLQPVGRGAVAHPADDAAVESGAALRVVGADLDRTGISARDRRRLDRLQRAETRRGEIAGDSLDPHRVLPVGGDGDVDRRVVEPGPLGISGTDRRVDGKLDDPFMRVAELKLAHRAHHSAALDSANCRHLQRQVAARHIGAGGAEHAFEAGARIGRAADDLDRLAGARVDREHLELVGLRVRCRGQHLRDDEGRELFGRVLDALDLEADAGERRDDFVQSRIRLEMLLQPRKGELHAPTPPERVGTSSAPKP